MTRDELLGLPTSQLATMILEYQLTIAQLRTRIAELESQLGAVPASGPGPEPTSRPNAGPEQVAVSMPDPVERVVPTGRIDFSPKVSGYGSDHPRHRHRPWYQKMLQSFSLDTGLGPGYILLGLLIILVAGAVGLLMAGGSLPFTGIRVR